jgi:coenzyme Q-binding protein COQ10
MATLKSARPFSRSCTRLPHTPALTFAVQRRTFLPNPFEALSPSAAGKPPSQILTAVRTLPYPSAPVYSIIADVPNYASFLPYCQRSSITKWSAPDKEYGRRWPSEGLLTSGFGGITESFVSRVYCVPGRYVESVGGDTNTSLKSETIAHHLEEGETQSGRQEGENGLLTHLRSKWTIEAMEHQQTQVSLAVEFAFSNPMYAALSGGVAPKVAEFMIRAFEKRVQLILEKNPEMVKAGLGEMEGSRLKR